jgi:hypothetical protein
MVKKEMQKKTTNISIRYKIAAMMKSIIGVPFLLMKFAEYQSKLSAKRFDWGD